MVSLLRHASDEGVRVESFPQLLPSLQWILGQRAAIVQLPHMEQRLKDKKERKRRAEAEREQAREMAEQEAAAIKIQKMQRGRRARKE